MPENNWKVPLSDVLVDDELLEAARLAMASGWWSMGPRVEAFEEAFADFVGARYALAVSNGTAALHLALLACGCGPGDEVVLPSLNFVAAANTIAHTGAKPVFCDVNGAHDLNLDVDDLEAAITPRTKAVLALHYGGHPCAMSRVQEIGWEHGLKVIEDAAHAPGATLGGRACGTFGDVGCFSFFSNKNLPLGEGGAVVTDDPELFETMRLLRSHGMTTLTWDRHRGHAHSYDVVACGFNFRLDEVRAAVGLVQLGRLREGNRARAAIVERYRSMLAQRSDFVLPFEGADDRESAHHLAVVVLPPGTARDEVRETLRKRGVQTSVHYPPIHHFSLYSADSNRALPRTDELASRIMTLPLFPHMADRHVDAVVDALLDGLAGYEPARLAPLST
jgi:dTDP-4-amino-4,6-dideoxygalactose transaminase